MKSRWSSHTTSGLRRTCFLYSSSSLVTQCLRVVFFDPWEALAFIRSSNLARCSGAILSSASGGIGGIPPSFVGFLGAFFPLNLRQVLIPRLAFSPSPTYGRG